MKWQTYEEVATYLLNHFCEHFGLERVEGKQKVKGFRTGTDWMIDAKGICSDGEGFIIVECRRYTASRQNQEKLGSLAFRILDTGAAGGILVSPLGLQAGAAKVAVSENILEVKLDAESTPSDFALRFLGRMMVGASIEERVKMGMSVEAKVIRICQTCGEQFVLKDVERICSTCSEADAT